MKWNILDALLYAIKEVKWDRVELEEKSREKKLCCRLNVEKTFYKRVRANPRCNEYIIQMRRKSFERVRSEYIVKVL
jgi:hypothetical protein